MTARFFSQQSGTGRLWNTAEDRRYKARKELTLTVNQNDIIRASARFTLPDGDDHVNVYHWRYLGTGDSDDDVMDAIHVKLSEMYAELTQQLQQNMDPYDIVYSIVDNVGGVEKTTRVLGTKTFTMSVPPASTGEMLPGPDAAIVNLRTNVPRVFGRKYISGIVETFQDKGVLNSSALTALGNYAVELLVNPVLTNGNLEPGVFSIKAGSAAGWWAAIGEGVVNAIMGSQRRRRKGRGA